MAALQFEAAGQAPSSQLAAPEVRQQPKSPWTLPEMQGEETGAAEQLLGGEMDLASMLGASSGPRIRLKDDVRRLSNSPRKLHQELLWHTQEAGRTAHSAQAHSPAVSANEQQQQQQGGPLSSLHETSGLPRPAQAGGAGRQGRLQAELPLARQVHLQGEQNAATLPGASFQQSQQAARPALLPPHSVKPQHIEMAIRELQQQQPGEAPPLATRRRQLCSIQAPAAAVGGKLQLHQQEGAAAQPSASAAAEGLQQQQQVSGTQGHVTATLANPLFELGRLRPQAVSSPSNMAHSAEQQSPGSGASSGQCNVK